ncbi:hypothetical protein K502DRAFT_322978 [Neoconidiobolus thromboides FSU 785]|nr:hypothetical protein K502DRAFT_322978 [Neoconidiobolus thromboides FSU 785]
MNPAISEPSTSITKQIEISTDITSKFTLNPNASVFKSNFKVKKQSSKGLDNDNNTASTSDNKHKSKKRTQRKKPGLRALSQERQLDKSNESNRDNINGSQFDKKSIMSDKPKRTHPKKINKKQDSNVNTKRVNESSPETSQSSSKSKTKSSKNTSTRQKKERNDQSKRKQPKELKVDQDLRSKLINELSNNTYECMVCWDNVKNKHQIWSCKSCYAIFHLSCIKKWSKVGDKQSENSINPFEWRCPGCQTSQQELPKTYLCFCERIHNPEPSNYISPHSCGQTCGKNRDTRCLHPCVEPCHPGPCPPCAALAPTSYCYCGKLSYQTRCLDKEADGKSCGEICGELLGCGEHYCELTCHEGACSPCKIPILRKCYCGQREKEFNCGTGIGLETYLLNESKTNIELQLGYYSCDKLCNRLLNCGNHLCNKPCHIQDELPGQCHLDPKIQLTCPCGKEEVKRLSKTIRTSCLDPIPLCGNVCSKLLPCGHKCKSNCHEGECPSCSTEIKAYCGCGNIFEMKLCSEDQTDIVCDKPCNQLKHCLKHRCNRICCDASRKGSEDIEGLHICTTICDKRLKCGNHKCQSLCHNGKCPPCMEASFDDLTCNCGKTKIQAPVPCGTKPPRCNYPCKRIRDCQHSSALSHNCHLDDQPCPPCTTLTTKLCKCGKKELKNIPCYRLKPMCGLPCNKMLPCGAHHCKQLCHEGPCLLEDASCNFICNKPRPNCEHPCQGICHAPSVCSNDIPCNTIITVSCKCGYLKKEKTCNGMDPTLQTILCNEQCFIKQRNDKLSLALGVNSNNNETIIDSSMLYDPYIFVFITPTQLKWVQNIEIKIEEFIKDELKRVLRFNPMRDYQRKFLHAIASNYQLHSISVDQNPSKSVEYTKTPYSKLPSIIPSIAYKNKKKYMKVEEEEINGNSMRQKQPVNCVLIRNLSMESTINYTIEKHMSDAGLKMQLFCYGYNLIVQPQHQLTDMTKVEELVRKCYYIVKASLISINIVAKVNLAWINSNNEIIWPKLETAPMMNNNTMKINSNNSFNILQNNEEINEGNLEVKAKNSNNTFNLLQCENNTLPPNLFDSDDKKSKSSRNVSPSRSITSKGTPESLMNINESLLSPTKVMEVVDDWTQLI